MTAQVFAVPVFFVVFREALETAVIVSVLLAFLKQTLTGPNQDVVLYKRLVRQVGRSPYCVLAVHACTHFRFLGVVRHGCWRPDMSDCRCGSHRHFLYPWAGSLEYGRVLLGGRFCAI